MNILILFPRFGIGGIAKASSFVANTLADGGHKVICVSMSDEESIVRLGDQIEKIYIPYEKGGIIRGKDKALFVIRMRSVLKSKRIECAIALGTDLVRIMAISSLGMKVFLIGSERGNPYFYTDKEKKKYTWALSKCKGVVFQTPEAKAYYPLAVQKNSKIIPNPCYINSEGGIVKSDLSRKVILVVSRISKEKNVLGIVKAFNKACDVIKDYELHIYGDGNRKAEIVNYVEKNSINGVRFYPNTKDPFELEAGASLFIINSVTEGMPNSLIEAMMYGIPCIASDCPPGGVRFLASNGERACLVPVSDDEKLSEAIIKVTQNEDYRNKLVQASAQIVDELDPKLIGQKWMDLIHA